MSEIKYGLISETDARTLEKTIDLITQRGFIGQEINITEIGIFDGQTARGLYEYVTSRGYGSASINPSLGTMRYNNYKCNYTAIDNEKDKLIKLPFPECKFIRGDSNEVYNQIKDDSQHLIFVDGCHCFAHVVSDFFCYAPKVKVGGYLAFHDTGAHIKPFKDYQHGDKENPDAFISVRKALGKIGLLPETIHKPLSKEVCDKIDAGAKEMVDKFPNMAVMMPHTVMMERKYLGWELIFDEADPENLAGGICVFKKLY